MLRTEYDVDQHLCTIKAVRDSGDWDAVYRARVAASSACALPLVAWKEWISDTKAVGGDVASVIMAARNEWVSPWLEQAYLDHCPVDPHEVLQRFKMHYRSGYTIAKQVVTSETLHQLVSCPIAQIEHAHADFGEYWTIELDSICEKAMEKRAKVVELEEELETSGSTGDVGDGVGSERLLKAWTAYWNQAEGHQLQCLFERSVCDLHRRPSVWIQYIAAFPAVSRIDRALKHCPGSEELWQLRLLAATSHNESSKVLEAARKRIADTPTLHRLHALFALRAAHASVTDPDAASLVTAWRQHRDRRPASLYDYTMLSLAMHLRPSDTPVLCTSLAASSNYDGETSFRLMLKLLDRGFPEAALDLAKTYVEHSTAPTDYWRPLIQHASQSICLEHGSHESMLCWMAQQPHEKAVTGRKRAREVSCTESTYVDQEGTVLVTGIDHVDTEALRSAFVSVGSIDTWDQRTSKTGNAMLFVTFQNPKDAVTAITLSGMDVGGSAITVKQSRVSAAKVQSGAPITVKAGQVEPKTVFVVNVPHHVQQQDLIRFFKGCGRITGVRFPSKKGLAYVSFSTKTEAQCALQLHGSVLDGNTVEVVESKPPPRTRASQIGTRLFIRNVPTQCLPSELEDALRRLLASCGPITSIDVTKQRRGFAFVEFDTPAAASKALLYSSADLMGNTLTISKARPPKDAIRPGPRPRISSSSHSEPTAPKSNADFRAFLS